MCELKKSSSNALSPTFGFMRIWNTSSFWNISWGLKMKGVEMRIAEDQFLMSYVYKNKCVN